MRLHRGCSCFVVSSLIVIPLAFPAFAAGPIVSGQAASGTIAGPSFSESWTFSGTAGERVLVGAATTSGALNTNITLKGPGGATETSTSADRVDHQLLGTGTYTIVIEDLGLNDPGTYNISLLNVTSGPLTNPADLDGGAIASAEIKTGQMNVIADFDAFTLSGTAGDRVLLGAVATGGASFNTTVTLYPPGGGAAVVSTPGDRVDQVLAQTGTYTVVVEDNGLGHTGTYSLSLLNLTAGPLSNGADPDGGTILSSDTKTAQINAAADFDAFRFTGVIGERIVIGALATGGTLNTNISLYPPTGAAVLFTSGDRAEYQLPTSGTYTIVIEDLGLDASGPYNLSFLNITGGPYTNGGDPDGGAIASAEIKVGQMNVLADFDAYTFTGTAGDRILIGAVATAGASFNTTFYLYPPGGGAAEVSTASDRLDQQLAQTGTYTVVIEDNALDNTGAYSLSLLNLTAGPLSNAADPDGGTILSADIRIAQVNGAADFDAFRFTGTSGQRVVIGALATGGALNTNISLYPPNGTPVLFTSADRAEYQLLTSGTYTIVIEDVGLDASGPYSLSFLNVTGGPLSNGADTDGGAIASAEIKTGQMNVVTDFDAFTFSGTAGDRVLLGAVATGGASFNTTFYLYPPGGGAAEASTAGDRIDQQLAQTGTYTVVVEDNALDHTGTYSLSLLNLTAGPLSNAADSDGGFIFSAETKTAQMNAAADFDAFRFIAAGGQRVVIGALATGGALNTNISLYPPSGPAVVMTSADRAEYQLSTAGTYTIVIEDLGLDASGTYSLSFLNVNGGPFNNGNDPDGGAIVSAQVKTGQMNVLTDFDAFIFSGTAGDRVLIGAVATGGASFNTTFYLYPPGGGGAEASTAGDRIDQQLAQTGTYTIVVEDNGLDHIGTYSLSLLNLTAGPLSNAADPDGGALAGGDLRSGSITPIPDFDAYRFNGATGDTAHITAATSSGLLNTNISIYPPGGGAPVVTTSADIVAYVLAAPGVHTIVIEDVGLDHTGNYLLTFQKSGVPVGVEPVASPFDRARVVLQPAFPNPFRATAGLVFSLPRELPVRLRIFDARGALVRTLVDGTRGAGLHHEGWDGRNDEGRPAPSGWYLAELRAGADTRRVRLVRIR